MGVGGVTIGMEGLGREWCARVTGWPSSTLPETVAVTAAMCGQGKSSMVIHTDNMAAVRNFKWLQQHRWQPMTRQLLKKSNFMALALQAEVCKARKGVPVQVEWVKGHAGNEGNEQADLKANEGRAEPILEQYWDGQDLIRWMVQVGGAVVEGKLRRNLELVTRLGGTSSGHNNHLMDTSVTATA